VRDVRYVVRDTLRTINVAPPSNRERRGWGQPPLSAGHRAKTPLRRSAVRGPRSEVGNQRSEVGGHWPLIRRHAYLAEDFSFSYRARAAGFKIYADTTIPLGHIGRYAFNWEEAGGSNQRFGTYIYRVLDANEESS
jgi:hypothetical protein